MKRMLCSLLAVLLLAFAACAEETVVFDVALPEGVQMEQGESSVTYVYGMTRVVAMTIERVPDAEPSEAVIRMMAQFDPDAVIGADLVMAEGYVGLEAEATDKFGEGVDQLTVMILSGGGDLFILSGYDMNGDETRTQALLDTLLAALTVDGERIVLAKE